ncbi:VOC family protein [Anaeromyxobacter terrae]|uniref:VOC family protein n=1 Tax=Anaeromyxobacter terrae TaxID=2925406 RepID=UPI001F58584A|nr:VOC family protein [Anaeromyxobacter sp. SG22]
MLGNRHFTAMLPVTDVARARRFYEETLGIHAGRTLPTGDVLYQLEGAEFALYPRETPPQSDHTAMSWDVPDVRAEVKDLRARGVRFEDYPELQTKDGILEKDGETCAWFKDPDGNILCIHHTVQ